MQKRAILAALFASLLLIQLSSASVSFSLPQTVYSLGDTLEMSIILNPSSNANGFFTATLRCDDEQVEIYRMPLSTVAGQQEIFSVRARLDNSLLNGLEGSCYVDAEHAAESGTSQTFEISSAVIATFDLQGNLFEPGQAVSFSGTAELKSGKPVNGTARVNIIGNSTSIDVNVIDGKFSGEIVIPDNAPSGNYEMQAVITEKSNGESLNAGKSSESFRVKQVVKAVEIALSEARVNADETLSYEVILYDQALEKAANQAKVQLISPLGDIQAESIASSGERHIFHIERHYMPGEWTISAETNGIISTANFNVAELKNVSVSIDNATVFVTNTGNVPYDLPLEIQVGDTAEVLMLNLEVGEEKTYRIMAPDGNYDLYAKKGDNSTVSLGQRWLTGKAVEVRDLSDDGSDLLKILSWAIILGALAAATYVTYRKHSMSRTYSSPNTSLTGPVKNNSPPAGTMSWKPSPKTDVKEVRKLSDIMMSNKASKQGDFGKKEEASVVALKIKNYDELHKYRGSEPAMNAIVQASGLAKSVKAQISREGNFTIFTFSQTATGSKDSAMLALKTAREIESLLKSHNRKYSRKVSFGIGVATGEMIVERKGASTTHTSLGTTVPSAKKIAEHAHEQLLLSDSTRNRLRGQIKVDKAIGGMYWSVQSVVDRSGHNEFINKFMERRADESKSF